MSHIQQMRRLFLRIARSNRDLIDTFKRILLMPISALLYLINARLRWRVLAAVGVLILAQIYSVLSPQFNDDAYALGHAESVLDKSSPVMAEAISYDATQQVFNFDANQSTTKNDIGQNTRATAIIHKDPKKGISVTDTINNVDFTMTPNFDLLEGRQHNDRIVYPLRDGKGWLVYTMRGIGAKEDILLEYATDDTLSYDYTLNLGDSMEAKIEKNGSLGVYGNSLFSGNISAGTDKDAGLLKKARENAPKDKLLFVIPSPVVVDKYGPANGITAKFTLDNDQLTVTATGLKNGKYPISIDPSIYVVTAAQFMHGNNETNINFDVGNKLIKKGSTTGARFDEWLSTASLPSAVWGAGTVPAGGYIYSVGGYAYDGQIFTTQGSDTFQVPTGITSITVEMWGAGGGGAGGSSASGGAGGGGGYVQATYTTTPGETLNVYVGGGGSGGGVSGADGGGGSGGGYSSVYRSSTPLAIAGGGAGGGGGRSGSTGAGGGAGGGTTGQAGSSSTTSNGGGGGTSSAGGSGGSGAHNSGSPGSPLTGGAGADGRTAEGADGSGATGGLTGGGNGGSVVNAGRSGGGGGGSGYYGGGGGAASRNNNAAAGGGGGSTYSDGGTSVTNTAGSGATPGNSSDPNRNDAADGGSGGSSSSNGSAGDNGIVSISYGAGGTNARDTVSWSQFDVGDGTLTSPNPGSGACSGWCTNSSYDLPEVRAHSSIVAYNGFLYAMGGVNNSDTRQDTVYVASLGVNGEPQLWHPTSTDKGDWDYWYEDTALSTIRAHSSAVAYNNRMYLIGGIGASAPVSTVQVADILPDGRLGSWSSETSLSSNLYGMSAQVYNDRLYVIGGAVTVGGAPTNAVYYNKIDSDGGLNGWVQTSSFTTGRIAWGGNFSVIWGGHVYISSGCGAVNGSGYCTTVQGDAQVASINADGSLDVWNNMGGLSNSRIGYNLIAWRDHIYAIGGCFAQNATTGECLSVMPNIDYGEVNQDGDASTVAESVDTSTSPCSDGTPKNCNLPSVIGNLLNAAVIYNGYLYVAGGCTNNPCASLSSSVVYAVIDGNGTLTRPAVCTGGSYQGNMWCQSPNSLGGGLSATSPVVFNNRIYFVGGIGGANNNDLIYRTTPNADGSIGTWTSQSLSGTGATSVSYSYAYTRANPASAGTNPGNLFIFGGCSTAASGAACTAYTDAVYKCNIGTAGAVASCSTSGQLQIGTIPGGSSAGLGVMSGAVFANYVYLIGGSTPDFDQLDSVRYAQINNSNNVVTVSSGWVESSNTMQTPRQRAAAFGYNGYLYVTGGYDGDTEGTLADIEYIKINTSDGSLGDASEGFQESAVTINQRWGLSVPVSNSFAYVIGGCTADTTGSCSSRTDVIQTFQIYNNDSGAPASYANGTDVAVDRIGASATVLNGYIYYAGGCSDISCSTVTNTTRYASIGVDGTIGTWNNGGTLPANRTFGKLLSAGGTLYYAGGQSTSALSSAVGTVYYTSGISSGNPTWNGSAATMGIGDSGSGAQTRTQFGAATWNNRLYILGGYNSSGTTQSTVYSSPEQSSGGNITGNWTTGGTSPSNTAFNYARSGLSVVAYANNLYILGGYDGTDYLADVQYAQIDTDDGSIGSWSYSESLPVPIQQGDAFASNGYIYLVGGRTASTTCTPRTLVAPISGNTSIASGNNPTGIGAWYQTNSSYSGDRYGNSAVQYDGKVYVLGGGCSAIITSTNRTQQSALLSQPQVAKYSIMYDTDTDVFPSHWLLNGIDNSTGARWQLKYQSMTNPGAAIQCAASSMSTWGQETDFGDVELGLPGIYTPLDGGGSDTSCARYFYINVTVDAQNAYGYPEDVSRGPTITDFTLRFTADPAKRLMHGRTFLGGVQMPNDTPYYDY